MVVGMKVIIFEEAIDNLLRKDRPSLFFMVGRIIEDEGLAQVFHLVDAGESLISDVRLREPFERIAKELIGFCTFEERSLDWILSNIQDKLELTRGDYIVCSLNQKEPTGYLIKPNHKKSPIDIVLPSRGSSRFARIERIVNSRLLGNKKITVVGAGSGGSKVALELARCGVGSINLIDFDRLEEHNIVRHICGYPDVGRLKTKAVKEVLKSFNPSIKIETFEIDVRKSVELFKRLVRESDLVIAATGVPQTNHFINAICIRENVDAVYAGVYERGSGGFVLRVIPQKTPCYDCIYDAILQTSPPVHLTDEQRALYSTVQDASELKAEPGISIDIGFICLLQAKMALFALLREEETELEDIPYNFLLWFNKSYGPIRPMSLKKVLTKKREKCATCQKEKWEEEALDELGLELSVADKLAHEILEELENEDSKR